MRLDPSVLKVFTATLFLLLPMVAITYLYIALLVNEQEPILIVLNLITVPFMIWGLIYFICQWLIIFYHKPLFLLQSNNLIFNSVTKRNIDTQSIRSINIESTGRQFYGARFKLIIKTKNNKYTINPTYGEGDVGLFLFLLMQTLTTHNPNIKVNRNQFWKRISREYENVHRKQ